MIPPSTAPAARMSRQRVAPRDPLADMPLAHASRLAVFGGSFDPVHNGHVSLAMAILEAGHADEVLFVPALRPPHKRSRTLTEGQHRLDMLKLALEPHADLSVSDIELQRGEDLSYTFDTLSVLRQVFAEPDLYFLMGMDSLADLHGWHRAGELVQHFDFIVYPRPDVSCPSLAQLSDRFGNRSARKLLASVKPDLPCFAVSSSEVRKARARGEDVARFCPEAVCRYIEQHELYRPGTEEKATQSGMH